MGLLKINQINLLSSNIIFFIQNPELFFDFISIIVDNA